MSKAISAAFSRAAPSGARHLSSVDAVVHLAKLANDPLGENDPELTFEINYQASVRLAGLAKAGGVKRFIYTSSCSVNGAADGAEPMTERSPLDPQKAYAKCKTLLERDVGAMGSSDFSPFFLRNATAYGASPRMRFDIVLNNLCGIAATSGKIAITSDGTPWRPLVHVLDICEAVGCALEAHWDARRGARQLHDVFDSIGAQVHRWGSKVATHSMRSPAALAGVNDVR